MLDKTLGNVRIISLEALKSICFSISGLSSVQYIELLPRVGGSFAISEPHKFAGSLQGYRFQVVDIQLNGRKTNMSFWMRAKLADRCPTSRQLGIANVQHGAAKRSYGLLIQISRGGLGNHW